MTGGLAIAGPLRALAGGGSQAQAASATGYGPLQNKGDIWLPDGFKYRIISTEGDIMSEGGVRHGYNFEIDADATGPVPAVPVVDAGRFVHEAVAWHKGILYETEDRVSDAALYRFVPNGRPRRPGDLAAMGGELQAQGSPAAGGSGEKGVTYAITGPWRRDEDDD